MTALLPDRLPDLPLQGTLDELGTPLAHVTFVVVDLETTGGSAHEDRMTEIGAVKVRGGQVLGELATLVDPQRGIPPTITVLTGITEAMVVGAPTEAEVVPAFLEFARGCVLVAHNAPFDTGFLRAAAERLGLAWPAFPVVDTARVARRTVTRDEARDCRLATLARLFRARVTPVHRALADAQATVDVLHGLLERVGGQGVHTLEELQSWTTRVPPEVRRKRTLADAVPSAPGCYLFRDGQGRPLYVGTSQDLRARVRSYFTAAETRTRMQEMVRLAERVDTVVCATALEASVRELRLIAEHQPRYNRRSRRPEKACWLVLSREAFPRLVLTRAPSGPGPFLGPFGSARYAEQARAALHEAFRVRQCSGRLPVGGGGTACALAGMGRCGAPCEGRETRDAYAAHATALADALAGDPSPVVSAVLARVARLAEEQRYEEAAVHRDRLRAFASAAARAQAAAALVGVGQLVAARRTHDGGWEVHGVRAGRLVGAAVVPRGAAPRPYVDALLATAEPVDTGADALAAAGPAPAALPEETRLLLRWLSKPGVRVVEAERPWASPARGAERLRDWLEPARDDAFGGRRASARVGRPVHQP